jgi:acyl-CoA hydrolase
MNKVWTEKAVSPGEAVAGISSGQAISLDGLSLRQRGEALISIAHPDFRARPTAELREQRHFALSTPP